MILRSLVAVAIGLIGFGCAKGGPPEDVYETIIRSVVKSGDRFIATTREGIFEASETEKVWRKVSTPSSMPAWGWLVQESATSPRLLYYTGTGTGNMIPALYEKGSLFVSEDAGKTWGDSLLDQDVIKAFAHPNGSIFAITGTQTTTPFPPGGDSLWTTDKDGVKHYPSEHLIESRDNGQAWKDITPPLRAAFGLFGIFRDPDHPDLVCVFSREIAHTSRLFVFQADDENYHWKEIPSEEWKGDELTGEYFLRPKAVGINNNDHVPATLENFFKFPFPLSGDSPELPGKYLISDKATYQFNLHQPMPITVSTFSMFPDPAYQLLDNKNVKVLWGLKIMPEGERAFTVAPQTQELYVNIPDQDAKIAAYSNPNDPNLITAQVDQSHPYQRVIDLRELYHFTKPGIYRLQIFHTDEYSGHAGNELGTTAIDVSIVP